MFVVRDTYHPKEDLKRNWSAPVGGSWTGDLAGGFKSAEGAKAAYEKFFETECTKQFRFHPAYNAFVEVHYEGLGAFQLSAETIEEAIKQARDMADGLACTMEAGDGHFFAEDVIGYHEVCDGRFVFEIKD